MVPVFTPQIIFIAFAEADRVEFGTLLTVRLLGAEIQPPAFFTVTE
jgi:hypothetical protein